MLLHPTLKGFAMRSVLATAFANVFTTTLASGMLLATPLALAQAKAEGYLCCNMRSDGRWISDSNYAESGKFVIPAGTPVKVLDYARYSVIVEFPAAGPNTAAHASGKQTLGNDYSRELPMTSFAARYVVADNPASKLASYPKKIQDAITSARVTKGMNREQVLMALGYPMASENPHLDAHVWRYWLWTFSEFKVFFNEQGEVSGVQTDGDTRLRVVMN
jgi:hypothetical protein